jgi:hypothetical protein
MRTRQNATKRPPPYAGGRQSITHKTSLLCETERVPNPERLLLTVCGGDGGDDRTADERRVECVA